MKKKQIISLGLLLILQISGTYLWSTPALFQEYSQYFSYDDSFTTGCKLDLSFAQGKFSTNFNNYNYGLNLFSEKYFKHFPCSIQIGNILIGGIISRLKNPSLDSDSGGYGNCYTEPAVITSELESFTSFSKPFSTFIELCYTDENNIIEKIKLNGSYTPSSNNANFAILGKFSTQNMISITGASGISLHFIEENKPIYWYSEIPYYSRRKSFSLGNQISINIKDLFYSNFSIFIYDSIVNKIGLVYKSENKIDLNNFTFGLSAFLNQNFYLITPENNILSPMAQLKFNIQYNHLLKNKSGDDKSEVTDKTPSLKTGFTIFTKIPLPHPAPATVKFGVATTLNIPLTTLLLSSGFTFDAGEQFLLTYGSTKLQSTWRLGKITPTLTLSSQLYFSSVPTSTSLLPPPKLNTHCHSISLTTNILGDFIEASSSFSFSCKNHNFYNKKLNFGLSLNGSYKKLLIIVKINGEFCI